MVQRDWHGGWTETGAANKDGLGNKEIDCCGWNAIMFIECEGCGIYCTLCRCSQVWLLL